ncbi:MAG: hypothetical protein GX024_01760 [Clostridiales bacterium]|jgi:hypothetical protein|nr:hypothetical protein [Clostridiales bacterium]
MKKDETDWPNTTNWLMTTASDENGIKFTALMTPPYNITHYATGNIIDPKAIYCLADGLKDYEIPGVMTDGRLITYSERR